MKTGKRFSKVLGGLLVGGMLLSASGIAMAGDAIGGFGKGNLGKFGGGGKPFGMMQKGGFGVKGGQGLQNHIDQLVKDGAITQAKADEIKAYLEKKAQEQQAKFEEFKSLTPEERKALRDKTIAENQDKVLKRVNLFDDLVTGKILTQEQADTVKAKLQQIQLQERQQKQTEAITALVKAGTITQAQADKVTKQFEVSQKEHQALHDKLDSMTDAERQQYFEDNQVKRVSPLAKLVEDKVITEDQAKALGEALGGHKGYGKGHMGGRMKGHMGGYMQGL